MSEDNNSTHQRQTYEALKLYEALLNLSFAVRNLHVVSTRADDLYVHRGLKVALQESLESIIPKLPKQPPEDLIPDSISGINESDYFKLQGYFGVIKSYANTINAHEENDTSDIQDSLDNAEIVLSGQSLPTHVLLSESAVNDYNHDTKTLTINGIPIVFDGAQEDYFLWAMFQKPLNILVSWDEIPEAVAAEFRDGHVFGSRDSIRQAMHRINQKIQRDIQTKDTLFSYKSNGFKRNFGPASE